MTVQLGAKSAEPTSLPAVTARESRRAARLAVRQLYSRSQIRSNGNRAARQGSLRAMLLRSSRASVGEIANPKCLGRLLRGFAERTVVGNRTGRQRLQLGRGAS